MIIEIILLILQLFVICAGLFFLQRVILRGYDVGKYNMAVKVLFLITFWLSLCLLQLVLFEIADLGNRENVLRLPYCIIVF